MPIRTTGGKDVGIVVELALKTIGSHSEYLCYAFVLFNALRVTFSFPILLILLIQTDIQLTNVMFHGTTRMLQLCQLHLMLVKNLENIRHLSMLPLL